MNEEVLAMARELLITSEYLMDIAIEMAEEELGKGLYEVDQRPAPHGGSYVVYTTAYIYGYMDVDDNMDIIPLEVSYKDQTRVYFIQIACWGLYMWM